MKLISTELKGVYIFENFFAEDQRGFFVKTYQESFFLSHNLSTSFKESYFSNSKKNVIRGMHFQLPPVDHEKLVYVSSGKILDVVLDIRKESNTFGKFISIELSSENHKALYIPKGLAHGFKSLKDESITVYNVSTEYSKEHDAGIKWDSFGMKWDIETPIVSERDQSFIGFDSYKNKMTSN